MTLDYDTTERYRHVLDQLPGRLLRHGEIHSEAYRQAVDAWRWGDGSLILLGPTGRGKTTAICALICRLVTEAGQLERGHPGARAAHSISFAGAQRLSKARSEAPLGHPPDLIQKALRTRLTAIDDLGAEDPRDSDIPMLLDDRYSAGRPVLVTSGLTKAQLAERYSPAFLRRLRETGPKPAVFVEDFGKDEAR